MTGRKDSRKKVFFPCLLVLVPLFFKIVFLTLLKEFKPRRDTENCCTMEEKFLPQRKYKRKYTQRAQKIAVLIFTHPFQKNFFGKILGSLRGGD